MILGLGSAARSQVSLNLVYKGYLEHPVKLDAWWFSWVNILSTWRNHIKDCVTTHFANTILNRIRYRKKISADRKGMDWTNSIFILFFFVLMIMYLLKIGSFWNTSNQNLPPGPTPLPLIGNLHIIDLKRPHEMLLKVKVSFLSMIIKGHLYLRDISSWQASITVYIRIYNCISSW